MFLPSLLHSDALLSCYRRWSNKVSNLKIHRQFCSHCLSVDYLKIPKIVIGWATQNAFVVCLGLLLSALW